MSHVDDGTLHAYLDGELAPAEAQGVAVHVAKCPACRNRLDEERELIARADELLGLAVPPERELPPFRPGDVKPPARLWWQVRLPLAWAATLVLAWAAGWYVRSGLVPPPSLERGVAVPRDTSASGVAAVVEEQARAEARPTRAAPPRRRERAPAAFEPQAKKADVPRDLAALPSERDRAPTVAVAPPAPSPPPAALAAGNAAVAPTPLTLDSARALLGTDPLAVPGLPVRRIYPARRLGYSTAVVVEQAIDSTTTIDVISGRPSSVLVEAVVVAGAAPLDTASLADRALRGRVARRTDSIAFAARGAVADQAAVGLVAEVRGPLAADSLAALRRRLQPLRP